MEKVLQSFADDASYTSYNNRNTFFEYVFDGRSSLLPFDAREMFEAEHIKDLDLIDRDKGTHIWKEM